VPALAAKGRHSRRCLLVSEANHVDHDIEVLPRHGREGVRVVSVAQDRPDVGWQCQVGALAAVESPYFGPAG
jgi:hypothetical protein